MKKILLAAAGFLIVLALVFVWRGLDESEKPVTKTELQVAEQVSVSYSAQKHEDSRPVLSSAPVTPEPEPAPDGTEEEAPPYVSPVDFEALQAMNEDIYAWLYVPGTGISSPLLQSAEEDDYYLNHNLEGRRDAKGALYTQASFNGKELNDPVTVVYGHNMKSGTMFGHMQELYSQRDALENYGEIMVYLPDRELHFTVFAAVPSGNAHILYYFDFSDPARYQEFLSMVYDTRMVGAQIDRTVEVEPGDQMLILSTCLRGNSKKRYLVLAVLNEMI